MKQLLTAMILTLALAANALVLEKEPFSQERFDELRAAGDHVIGVERELEQVVIDEQTVAELWRKLTPPEREVAHLWAVEGYTATEIALQLGLPRGAWRAC